MKPEETRAQKGQARMLRALADRHGSESDGWSLVELRLDPGVLRNAADTIDELLAALDERDERIAGLEDRIMGIGEKLEIDEKDIPF